MATNVIMPSLGFDMTQGKVARWSKQVGDTVERGETIGEIETEKATVELTATASGILAKILVPAGETVPVNTPIAIIAAPGEVVETAAGPVAAVTASRAAVATPSEPAPMAAPSGGEDRIKASPVARNIAKAEGIDLATIRGTGPGGRIIERDVLAAIQARVGTGPRPVPTAAPTPIAPRVVEKVPEAVPLEEGPGVQLSKMRQTIARRLLESKTTIPHYYLTIEILMDEAMKLRQQLNALAASEAEKISVNDIVIAAVARTLRGFPNVNASFKGDRIERHEHIHVGMAVAVEDGLLTPVLRDADRKTLKQIAVETKEIAARARGNKLKPEDLGPGTFTVSNLGMYGIEEFAAIINPPEAAILAVGAVRKVPVVLNDAIAIAQVMKVTLSADHRIVDGALGARFLQELKKLLENPMNLLLA